MPGFHQYITRGTAAARPSTGVAIGHLYFATDTGAVTRWSGSTWESYSGAAGAGALVLLSTQTAAASASLNFTSLITATYDEYLIELIDIVPVTTNVNLWFRASTNNGASYDAGANYSYSGLAARSATVTGLGATGATAFLPAGGATLLNTAANGGFSGSLRLFNPLSAAIHKALAGYGALSANDGNRYGIQMAGWYVSITAVDAFQFLMSSGNIASGIIRLYGVAKS